jgi:dTDP-4-dehydrorhamnose reductase
MRILLTGASGLLGQAIQNICDKEEILCCPLNRDMIFIQNLRNLCEFIKSYDVIIHAAANTDVEGCEVNYLDCYRDNTLLTEILFSAASIAGVKMVYISSTGVYGNYQNTPYHEYNNACPTSHHHKSKLLAELVVLKNPSSLIVRTGWIFGGEVGYWKNFVANRIKEAKNSDGIIYSNSEQCGNPTYVTDIAARLLKLINYDHTGIYNCVNEGSASRFEYVTKIVEYSGVDVNVLPAPSESFNRLANVSNNEMALNVKMLQCGYELMPVWSDSLKNYISDLMVNSVD